MAKKSYQQKLAGPPVVRSWQDLNPKRDGSPCVLRRKFGYVRTRHQRLGKAERLLEQVKSLPENERHPEAVRNLSASVENHRAWLNFSCQTLEQHCKFAVARFDGKLDEVKPLASGRKRGSTGGNGRSKKAARKIRKLVEYLRGELDVYIACCAVAAGTSGQNAAMKLLMRTAKPVVDVMKARSGREPELAEQLAWKYLWEKTAKSFDPASEKSNMAKFNTYFSPGARRATQLRTHADAPPGKIKVGNKFVSRGSIHTVDETSDAALNHPVFYDADTTLPNAVQAALADLGEDERRFAVLRFIERSSLRDLATEYEISVHQVRKLEQSVGEKLRDVLGDFAQG